MLILIGWRARPLALVMLGVNPVAYLVGVVGIRVNSAGYASSRADWGGMGPILVYLGISAVAFVTAVWATRRRKQRGGLSDGGRGPHEPDGEDPAEVDPGGMT